MDAIEIIAHRGSSFVAPENTLLSANLAWDEGADAVEGDFRLTRDGQIVAMHDDTLARTTGANRRVDQCDSRELQALDAGSWKDPAYTGEPVPTLAELLATVPPSRRFYAELKCGAEIIEPLGRVIAECGLRPPQVVPIALDLALIAAVKRAIPQCPAYWVVEFKRDGAGNWHPAPDEMIRAAHEAKLDGLDLMASAPMDAQLVRRLHEEGLRLCVWTVDDPAAARGLIELGIEGITTNRPGWLREQLRG